MAYPPKRCEPWVWMNQCSRPVTGLNTAIRFPRRSSSMRRMQPSNCKQSPMLTVIFISSKLLFVGMLHQTFLSTSKHTTPVRPCGDALGFAVAVPPMTNSLRSKGTTATFPTEDKRISPGNSVHCSDSGSNTSASFLTADAVFHFVLNWFTPPTTYSLPARAAELWSDLHILIAGNSDQCLSFTEKTMTWSKVKLYSTPPVK